ncbi:MAG: hypothetical protein ACI9E4_000713 [Pseudohongiellaceae bacterium]|jgi:hypothetical protein
MVYYFNIPRCLVLFSSILFALLAVYGQAHHSTSGFDSSTQITITGTVARVEWVNPHVYIYIDSKSNNGETVRWEIESQPPTALRRMGWSRDMLAVGETIAVTGNPTKNGADSALLGQLFEKVDGVLFDQSEAMAKMTADAPVLEQTADSLAGIWTSKIDFGLFPHFFFGAGEEDLTDRGDAAREAYDENTMNPGISCIPLTPPSSMLMADTKRITITDQAVKIASDYNGVERTIHTNVQVLDVVSESMQGYSVGRWEGDTLIVDTTQFTPNAIGNGAGLPSSSQKRLTERISLNTGGKSITYTFELTDPVFIAPPITGRVELDYRIDLDFVTEECSPDNAERYLKYF